MSSVPAPPFVVTALYPYQSDHPDDLSFETGEKIEVQSVEDDDWFSGNSVDDPTRKGMFPRNFVEVSQEPSSAASVTEQAAPSTVPAPVSAAIASTGSSSVPASASVTQSSKNVAGDDDGDDGWSEEEDNDQEESKSIHIGPPPTAVAAASSGKPAAAPASSSAPVASSPSSAPIESVTNKLSNIDIKDSSDDRAPSSAPVSHSHNPDAAEEDTSNIDHKPTAATRNAFKDRIAAFNVQSEAAPIVPGQQKFSSFVKKPYVPPPSSYVPSIPKSQPSVSRTNTFEAVSPSNTGSPVISNSSSAFERQASPPPAAVDHSHDQQDEEEAVPKMSLKERIKLLQQQQQEEQERVEAAALRKKQKAKAKKASAAEAVHDDGTAVEEGDHVAPAAPAPLERTLSSSSRKELHRVATGGSIASVASSIAAEEQPLSPASTGPRRSGSFSDRKQSIDRPRNLDDSLVLEGDETQPAARPAIPTRAPLSHDDEVAEQEEPEEEPEERGEEAEEEEEDDDEDYEDDEEDEEEAKRIALRERMAKISGGMGMNLGMLMTGGFPQPSAAKSKPKTKKASKPQPEEEQVQTHQAPVPMFPFADPKALAALQKRTTEPAEEEEEQDEEPEQTERVPEEDTVQETDEINQEESAVPAVPEPEQRRSHLPPPPLPPLSVPEPTGHAPPVPQTIPSPETPSRPAAHPVSSPPIASAPPIPSVARSPSTSGAPPPPPPQIPDRSIPTEQDPVYKPPRRSSTEPVKSQVDEVIEGTYPGPGLPPAAGAPPQTLVAPASQENLKRGFPTPDSSEARGATRVWGGAPAAGGTPPTRQPLTAADELGDDERTESEEGFRGLSKRHSYIGGSGAIPPVPISPSSTGRSPIGAVPRKSRTVDDFSDTVPHSRPPPPPLPVAGLPPQVPEQDNFSDETTGYEADEDTDIYNSKDEASGSPRAGFHGRQLSTGSSSGVDSSHHQHQHHRNQPVLPGRPHTTTGPPPPIPGGIAPTSPPVPPPGVRAPPPPPPVAAPPPLGLPPRPPVDFSEETSSDLQGSDESDTTEQYEQDHSSGFEDDSVTPVEPVRSAPRGPPPPAPIVTPMAPVHNVPPPIPPVAPPVAPPGAPPVAPPAAGSTGARGSSSVSPSTTQGHFSRRSIDQRTGTASQGRTSLDSGNSFVAHDIDPDVSSQWWTVPNGVPSAISRNLGNLIYEIDDSQSTKRGGRVVVSRDVYVLYHDYSQSVITARYDQQDPVGSVVFEQTHTAPPSWRQDQLEDAYKVYGRKVLEEAQKLSSSGSSSSANLVADIVAAQPRALPAIGRRAYGALVYDNLANASVKQFDEIRPGDIVAFRNAHFQGHKGSLHTKYSVDVGKDDSISSGVIYEWDGTKKKIRVYIQPESSSSSKTSSGKLKQESYRLSDLKSGEVRVYRVVGRNYVDWE
ncbi:Bbc1p [Sugiyamaella lignohabitans]|uniref:Bbc1p n=1 Tax=Sugiyamaella lignohabitans TaxID=796027 RepID=A0A167CCQ8_9ASCO|nr:Bbc1p [Sugiyamaella lignohabitans]ANB11514.1 Bbc1p [Sugiyamaella lignohabitans]